MGERQRENKPNRQAVVQVVCHPTELLLGTELLKLVERVGEEGSIHKVENLDQHSIEDTLLLLMVKLINHRVVGVGTEAKINIVITIQPKIFNLVTALGTGCSRASLSEPNHARPVVIE